MKFSRLSRFLLVFVFLGGVALAKGQQNVPVQPFSDDVSEDILYTADLSFKDFGFSGLFAVKSEENAYHIYFISKTGFTVIEALLKPNETDWIKTLPFLEKTSRKEKLDREFRLLVQSPLKFSKKIKYTRKGIKVKLEGRPNVMYTVENGRISGARTKGFLHLIRTKIKYETSESGKLPESIQMRKTCIDAEINLKRYDN